MQGQPIDYRGWLQQTGNGWANQYVGNDYNNGNFGTSAQGLHALDNTLDASGGNSATDGDKLRGLNAQYVSYLNSFNAPTSSGGNGGGGGGYSRYASSGPDYTALANAYNAQFDAQTQGLQNSMNLNQQIANTGKTRLESSYGVQKGGLDQQLAFGNSNLDLSQNKLDLSKANSLRDLGNQLRLASQGYSNQAGIMGAGDSSAMSVLNYALSNQGNRMSNDINQNVAQQQTGLNLQRSQLKGSYDQNVKMLDDWHANQLQAIINQYATIQQQLQQSLTNAKGQKAIDLAYIGKGQAANQAIQQMQSLQATYNANLNQLQSSYSNMSAPNAALGNDLTREYNVTPIDAGSIKAASLQNNQAGYTPTYTNAGLRKTDTNGNPIQ